MELPGYKQRCIHKILFFFPIFLSWIFVSPLFACIICRAKRISSLLLLQSSYGTIQNQVEAGVWNRHNRVDCNFELIWSLNTNGRILSDERSQGQSVWITITSNIFEIILSFVSVVHDLNSLLFILTIGHVGRRQRVRLQLRPQPSVHFHVGLGPSDQRLGPRAARVSESNIWPFPVHSFMFSLKLTVHLHESSLFSQHVRGRETKTRHSVWSRLRRPRVPAKNSRRCYVDLWGWAGKNRETRRWALRTKLFVWFDFVLNSLR